MSLSYAWEKLYSAVLTLATGTGDIRKRIEYACSGALIRLTVGNDLPPDLRGDFDAIMATVTKLVSFEASAAALTEIEAADVAEKIVNLFHKVVRLDAIEQYETDKRTAQKPLDPNQPNGK